MKKRMKVYLRQRVCARCSLIQAFAICHLSQLAEIFFSLFAVLKLGCKSKKNGNDNKLGKRKVGCLVG